MQTVFLFFSFRTFCDIFQILFDCFREKNTSRASEKLLYSMWRKKIWRILVCLVLELRCFCNSNYSLSCSDSIFKTVVPLIWSSRTLVETILVENNLLSFGARLLTFSDCRFERGLSCFRWTLFRGWYSYFDVSSLGSLELTWSRNGI